MDVVEPKRVGDPEELLPKDRLLVRVVWIGDPRLV